jgi:hypothetical protein
MCCNIKIIKQKCEWSKMNTARNVDNSRARAFTRKEKEQQKQNHDDNVVCCNRLTSREIELYRGCELLCQ